MEKLEKEESQLPSWIFEWAHQQTELEKRVLLLLADHNIEIDELLKQLDVLSAQNDESRCPEEWELFVTSLTHDIEQRCAAVEAHLKCLRLEGSN